MNHGMRAMATCAPTPAHFRPRQLGNKKKGRLTCWHTFLQRDGYAANCICVTLSGGWPHGMYGESVLPAVCPKTSVEKSCPQKFAREVKEKGCRGGFPRQGSEVGSGNPRRLKSRKVGSRNLGLLSYRPLSGLYIFYWRKKQTTPGKSSRQEGVPKSCTAG